MDTKQHITRVGKILIPFFLFCILGSCFINFIMYSDTKYHDTNTKKEYAIVLGASVHGSILSSVLRARMEVAVALYQKGLVKNILLSGDGTDAYYNETKAMKKFALDRGVPQDVILTDEKGYNTFETMFRAKKVFSAQSAYIISQEFHLTRAVWIAHKVGINAEGASAGKVKNSIYYDVREFFARVKDFFQIYIQLA